jgi:hypothetical protein
MNIPLVLGIIVFYAVVCFLLWSLAIPDVLFAGAKTIIVGALASLLSGSIALAICYGVGKMLNLF